MQLLEEDSDTESIFCGPPGKGSELCALKAWGIGVRRRTAAAAWPSDGDEKGRRGKTRAHRDNSGKVGTEVLIQPPGVMGESGTFMCCFPVGLEEDQEFGLVHRIGGQHLRRIAKECDATLRLRGIGSSVLEGPEAKEANVPLQVLLTCTNYPCYELAAGQIATLLHGVFKHYRRYVRSKGMEPPLLKLNLHELVRSDLNINLPSPCGNLVQSGQTRRRQPRRKVRNKGQALHA